MELKSDRAHNDARNLKRLTKGVCMARMLRSTDSVQKHVDVVVRHLHLCAQVDGTDFLRQAIMPALDEVREKKSRADAEGMNLKYRYDGILLYDRFGDNGIRELFEQCRQIDRKYPGSHVFNQVFPQGKITHLIRCSITAQLSVLSDIIMRAENLGSGHAVAGVTAGLREKAVQLKAAIMERERQKEVCDQAQTALDLALEKLRRQYAENYHNAMIRFGASFADGLFPRQHVRRERDVISVPESTPQAATA